MIKSTFICPYCFQTPHISSVEFRCSNKRCEDFDDFPLTVYEQGDTNMPLKDKKTFRPDKKSLSLPTSAICPECNNTTFKYVCPCCHNEIPSSSLTGKDMIISIVGSRATGKSHFIGVIIKELRDHISVSFGGSLEGFGDSYQRWMTYFGQKLYTDNVRLDQTSSSLTSTENGAYRPLIFKLKLKKKSFLRSSLESFTFVFYDTAGEDLNDQDTMKTVNKYICKSSGIIFLLDPLQIPEVAVQLDHTIVKRAGGLDWNTSTKSDDIMTRVSNLIREDRNMSDTKVINTPVAAVFSKFDTISSLISPDFTVLQPSPHCNERQFNVSDWHNVNSEILSLLHEWNATAFISQLETNYKTHSYFAASALGLNNNPTESDTIQVPRPHRIEDALLWILRENGVIS